MSSTASRNRLGLGGTHLLLLAICGVATMLALGGCPSLVDESLGSGSSEDRNRRGPGDGEAGLRTYQLLLDWPDIDGAASYSLYVGTTSPLDGNDFVLNTSDSQFRAVALDPGTVYYWQFVAKAASGQIISRSPVWSFRTEGESPGEGGGGSGSTGFSEIPAGGYDSDEIRARAFLVGPGGDRLEIANTMIYHAIFFDAMGQPWDFDENGPSQPIVGGNTSDSMDVIFSTITRVSSTATTVHIEGRERLDLFGDVYEGPVYISYTLQPDGTLQFVGEKDLHSSDGSGYEMDYSGILEWSVPF